VARYTGFGFREQSSFFTDEFLRAGPLRFNFAQKPCRRAPSKWLILFTAKRKDRLPKISCFWATVGAWDYRPENVLLD